MSSTNRGAVRSDNDFYETQRADAMPIIEKIAPLLGPVPWIWEPTAGRGALVKLLRERIPTAKIYANEIDAGRCDALHAAGADVVTNLNLFSEACRHCYQDVRLDCALTNPPFVNAVEVAEFLIPRATHVVLLQRVNWLASLDRLEFWQRHPADVHLLPRRPSFAASLKCAREPKPCGWKLTQYLDSPRPKACPDCQAKVLCATSDSIEYAWFHFHAGSVRQYSHLARVETTQQGTLAFGEAS